MKCTACEFEKEMKENPKGIVNLYAHVHTCNQPERLNETASIPEYGSASSLNFDEWQRRCESLNNANE
jgi:hypothetical protein